MVWFGKAYVTRVVWSEREDAAIRAARAAVPQVSWRELAIRIGRSEGSVAARWHRLRELAGGFAQSRVRAGRGVRRPRRARELA
jgi:hypothetical protein